MLYKIKFDAGEYVNYFKYYFKFKQKNTFKSLLNAFTSNRILTFSEYEYVRSRHRKPERIIYENIKDPTNIFEIK